MRTAARDQPTPTQNQPIERRATGSPTPRPQEPFFKGK
jgi:hypothetical protein